jgi:hypothetical protein
LPIFKPKAKPCREVIPNHDVRALQRAFPGMKILSRHGELWHAKGKIILVGDPTEMIFNNCEHEVFPILLSDPERFILTCELEENAWFPGTSFESLSTP